MAKELRARFAVARRRKVQRYENLGSFQVFTLLELIIVILVVSISAAVIVPRMGEIRPFALDAAVQRLVADMRYAQRLAMSRHQIHGVSFKITQERYIVYQGSEATPVDDPFNKGSDFIVNYAEEEPFKEVDLYSANFGGATEVRFDSYGTPLDTSDTALETIGAVTLRSGNNEIVIQIIPNTGKIDIVR